jgi:hypothetical protein
MTQVHGGMTILLENMEIKDECFVYGYDLK